VWSIETNGRFKAKKTGEGKFTHSPPPAPFKKRNTNTNTIIEIGRVSQTQLMNILLLRRFIYIVYHKSRSNYMFRLFYLGHVNKAP